MYLAKGGGWKYRLSSLSWFFFLFVYIHFKIWLLWLVRKIEFNESNHSIYFIMRSIFFQLKMSTVAQAFTQTVSPHSCHWLCTYNHFHGSVRFIAAWDQRVDQSIIDSISLVTLFHAIYIFKTKDSTRSKNLSVIHCIPINCCFPTVSFCFPDTLSNLDKYMN